jgi:hypothetical protein
MSHGRILVAGSLAQRPGIGGHAWVFLQYLLGFRRLGFEVLFLDWLDEKMCQDNAGRPCRVEDSWNLRYLAEVMGQCGLGDAWSIDYNQGERTFGVPREKVLACAKDADLLFNVMGFLRDSEILGRVRRRAFLDIDPGFGQMWQDLGWATMFGGHDLYVTIGEKIGQSGCTIPTCGIQWITTPQPVVLEHWPAQEPNVHGAFTSIASWRGPFGPIEYRGRTYGLRVHEFRKFAALPRLSSATFDLALEIDPAEAKDISMLVENGWRLVDPRKLAGTTSSYRQFIQKSGAELMIAKNIYVASRGGWFSDRSICYLASGKPVLAQETGFTDCYPSEQGLIAFTTLEEAAAGVEKIRANYDRHARAARAIAEEYFDSDKVLGRLLEKVG